MLRNKTPQDEHQKSGKSSPCVVLPNGRSEAGQKTPPRLIGICLVRHCIQYGEHLKQAQHITLSPEAVE